MSLVKFYCPEHGYLCQATTHAVVLCGERLKVNGRTRRCNRKATTVNAKSPKKRGS